jgi:hypothetical protein
METIDDLIRYVTNNPDFYMETVDRLGDIQTINPDFKYVFLVNSSNGESSTIKELIKENLLDWQSKILFKSHPSVSRLVLFKNPDDAVELLLRDLIVRHESLWLWMNEKK